MGSRGLGIQAFCPGEPRERERETSLLKSLKFVASDSVVPDQKQKVGQLVWLFQLAATERRAQNPVVPVACNLDIVFK